jgi:hypothetical protein
MFVAIVILLLLQCTIKFVIQDQSGFADFDARYNEDATDMQISGFLQEQEEEFGLGSQTTLESFIQNIEDSDITDDDDLTELDPDETTTSVVNSLSVDVNPSSGFATWFPPQGVSRRQVLSSSITPPSSSTRKRPRQD